MSLPRIATREEWLAGPQGAADRGEGADPPARRAQHRAPQPADGRDRRRTTCSTARTATVAPDRPVRGPAAADHLPLHVRPGVGRRLPELHRRHRRDLAGLPRAPAHPRHQLRDGVAGAAREARAVEGEAGLGHPVVLVVRDRLQLRLRRHDRRVARLDEYNYRTKAEFEAMGDGLLRRPSSRSRCPAAAASCRSTAACSTPTRSTPAASSRTGGSYYFLDLTALGRQEDWEEPKGRSESVRRSAVPDFAS